MVAPCTVPEAKAQIGLITTSTMHRGGDDRGGLGRGH